MTDQEIAQALNQAILGNKHALPCGCILEKKCMYPGKDWVRVGVHLQSCAEHAHPYPYQIKTTRTSWFEIVGKPLSDRWFKVNGDEVQPDELKQAMDVLTSKARFKASTLKQAIKIYECPDPWVISQEMFYLINRQGHISEVEDWMVQKFGPGDVIDMGELMDWKDTWLLRAELFRKLYKDTLPLPIKIPVHIGVKYEEKE